MSEDWKSRVQRPADFWFWGYMLRKFQGEHLKPDHILAFCQASFLMTLSRVGFLTLAPGKKALVIANTHFQPHKRRLYTWTSSDGQYQNQIDYILCSQRWRRSIQSAEARLGVDCGSDHKLLIAKFRLKLKKVGKTTRPFRYDLNQIPYDYTVEVRNRFKELDLIDRVPDELWNEVCNIVQETGIKIIPMEKKCKKAKWLSGEAL